MILSLPKWDIIIPTQNATDAIDLGGPLVFFLVLAKGPLKRTKAQAFCVLVVLACTGHVSAFLLAGAWPTAVLPECELGR